MLSVTTQSPTIRFGYGGVTKGVPVSRDLDLLVEFPFIRKTNKVTGRNVNHDMENSKYYSYYLNDAAAVSCTLLVEGKLVITFISKAGDR